ncbi:MAG: roadblock/LC7 domain-containing protein [Gemmatimonadota bacterium]|nr:roadblock/LC7 domain-containing protein [Gemmatimonadota bacterium]
MSTIRDVVHALARRPGVKAAIVLGHDGLPIDSVSANGLDPDSVAALVPPLVSACRQLGDTAACGAFTAGAVEFDDGLAVVELLTSETLLALVVAPGTNVGALLYELRKHRAAIAGLL